MRLHRVLFMVLMVGPLIPALAKPELHFAPRTGGASVKIEAATFALSIGGVSREVTVDPFFIRTSLVTVAEYSIYLADSPGAVTPEYWRELKENPNQPVTGLDLRAIVPFLKWLSASDSQHVYRLPTEAEWRRAFSLNLLDREDNPVDEFLLDRYSASFSEWGDQESPIRNPFGPVSGLNVVGLRVLENRVVERGPIAPDHVSLQAGFRYAFSLSGPGPVGARMMKEAMAKGDQLPPGMNPPASPPPQPTTTTTAPGFQPLFAEFMRLQGELAAEQAAYKTSHPAFALFEQSKSNPLRLACRKATETLKQKRIPPAEYQKVATTILPRIKPLIPLAIAQTYGNLIHQTVTSHPPRDEVDQSFYQVLNPMLKEREKAQGARFEMPFPEGSVESLTAYYLIGYELERFQDLWWNTIGRYPSEIREKEARATALGKELMEKYPTEFQNLMSSLAPFLSVPKSE